MSARFHPYLCGRNAAEWLINMNDHKNGGRKSAPVQTGHDHRAGKREHSDAGHMPAPDAVPKSKAHAPDGISGYWE